MFLLNKKYVNIYTCEILHILGLFVKFVDKTYNVIKSTTILTRVSLVANSINIQGRIIVLVHCPSSHCHLSINQVSFQSLLYFPRYMYGPDK